MRLVTFVALSALLVLACSCQSGSAVSPLSFNSMQTDFSSLVHKYANSEWKDEFLSLAADAAASGPEGSSFLEVSSQTSAKAQHQLTAHSTESSESGASGSSSGSGSEAALVGSCEVCIFVVENKQQHQPYLCRGLKDPNYQKACVEVMESLMWWVTNEVYWLNYGCQRTNNGAVEWVRPCPAHAVCSWIEQLYTRTPFCPADIAYLKPQ